MSIEPNPEDKVATEAGHWYLPDGSPYYEIMGKTTGRLRPVTLADARKVNAVPSVTTVLKNWSSRGLDYYKLEQMCRAVQRTPRFPGESDYEYFGRCRGVSDEHRDTAASKGTDLHWAIECHLLKKLVPKQYEEHVCNVIGALSSLGIFLDQGASEKSFAHKLGFGGKVDWHTHEGEYFKDGYGGKECGFNGIVIDFKSKPKIEKGKTYGYLNHRAQLGAYRKGLGIPNARALSVFVGIEDAEVQVLEWTQSDLMHGYEFFKHLLCAWKIDNTYWPKL